MGDCIALSRMRKSGYYTDSEKADGVGYTPCSYWSVGSGGDRSIQIQSQIHQGRSMSFAYVAS
jgi:hypothetical protein